MTKSRDKPQMRNRPFLKAFQRAKRKKVIRNTIKGVKPKV